MEWVLILFFHAGILSNSDSMAALSVPGFATIQECQSAGHKAEEVTEGTTKATRFTCLMRTGGHK